MHRCRATCLVATLAFLAGVPAAQAANIAQAKQKDGSVIRLTDEMLPECNRLHFHGAARIEKASKAQPACWTFDWKRRVFTVIPLTPRSRVQGVLAGVLEGLGSGADAAMKELAVRYDVDSERRISLPADKFQWLSGSKAPAAGRVPGA